MFVGMWRKQGIHSLLVRVQTYAVTVSNEISAAVPQEAGNRATSRSSYTTLGIYPKDTSSCYRDICLTIFTDALFITVRKFYSLDVHQLMNG